MSLVSLITPTYNQGEFLTETIESVLAQTHPAIDYLVIDDGSTDSTAEVLAHYASRVRSERQDNIGQAATLNRGWNKANGKYLSYLSSDDLLYPDAIAHAVEILDCDPSIVCVFPNADYIDPKGRNLRRQICRPFDHEAMLVRQVCWIGPGAVFRADQYHAIGGWRPDLHISPDLEFWLRLGLRGKFHFIPETLAAFRLHRRSTTFSRASESQAREYLSVLDLFFARDDVPPTMAALHNLAYGNANYLIALLMLRDGRVSLGVRYWREARRLAPLTGNLGYTARLLRAIAVRLLRRTQLAFAARTR